MDNWYWIPIVAIIAWAVVGVSVGVFGGKNAGLKTAIEENTATNKVLLAKLETIDTRLTAVEKTLNDIP